MTSLQTPAVRSTLERLYSEAESTDARILPIVQAEVQRQGGVWDDQQTGPLLDDAFIPVSPEVGRLLYMLVRTRQPMLAVEFGTSLGLSAIHIAAALRDNGKGRLIATELNEAKARRARAHLQEAGLQDWVEVRQGDAFDTLSGVAAIEFLLLDGWKGLYLPMLQKLEPGLGNGCFIVADDLKLMPEMLAGYLRHVRDPGNGYTSCELPMDDGLELSLRN